MFKEQSIFISWKAEYKCYLLSYIDITVSGYVLALVTCPTFGLFDGGHPIQGSTKYVDPGTVNHTAIVWHKMIWNIVHKLYGLLLHPFWSLWGSVPIHCPFRQLREEYFCLFLQVRLLLSHTNQNKQAFNQLSNLICSVYRSRCISVKSAGCRERERETNKEMYFLCNLAVSVLEPWWW